jgi:hypothetical protein
MVLFSGEMRNISKHIFSTVSARVKSLSPEFYEVFEMMREFLPY